MSAPREAPLAGIHRERGAAFTDFGGWQMPLRYGSDTAEHRAVREAAGLFDLSHMGEIEVHGPDAARMLDHALTGRISAVRVGRAKYTLICGEDGGVIDDLIVYRLAEDRLLVVPNAGNAPAVARALAERAAGFDAAVRDASSETALVALQGPAAAGILLPLADARVVRELRRYAAVETRVAGVTVLLARTGYTGEDGFELFVPAADAPALWTALEAAGSARGLEPCGLAARDSLRLEAGMPLYGNELTRDRAPFAAGLGWAVALDKDAFVGRDALAALAGAGAGSDAGSGTGSGETLVGLRGTGRRAARPGYAVVAGDDRIGTITSGQPSPTLGVPIAMAYIEPAHAAPGTAVEVDIRGTREPFEIVPLPFYRRA